MNTSVLAILMMFISATTALADNTEEILAIEKTARNYMASWYQGDAKKMEAVLHRELAKRSLQSGYGPKKELRMTTAADMISWTKSGYGKSLWSKDMDIEVSVLDIYNNIACVKAVTKDYYEYLHLLKIDGKWVIVNALYDKNSPVDK